MFKNIVSVAFSMFLLFSIFSTVAMAEPSAAEAEAIEYLIEFVQQSHQTFIRNGQEHDTDEASAHIREKYAMVKSQILTAEEFIERAASKSMLTGRPYMIKLSDGTQIEIKSWLMSELAKYREQKKC